MNAYLLPAYCLKTEYALPSFLGFEAPEADASPALTLAFEAEAPEAVPTAVFAHHRDIDVSPREDAWRFSLPWDPACALSLNRSGTAITVHDPDWQAKYPLVLPLLRTAIECASMARGVVSLHSACVEMDDAAVCFTAPSGTGKSTRAQAWINALGAQFISGDRPSLRIEEDGATVCGVPWDGKEQVFRNVRRPLKYICEVRRSEFVGARKLSTAQKRRLLMQQCFIPMWDQEAAVAAMANVRRLIDRVQIIRLFCGPDEESARQAYDLLFNHPERIQEAKREMKARDGFVMRSIVGENIIMPTGDNIGKYDGTVVLNEVSALVWEKIQNPISREDLLECILAEFEVDRDTAARDLDALLKTFEEYELLEPERD